jgi:general secretion pathway protein B
MSFILDALRKSEHERERKTLPGLAEVPVVRQDRPKVPVAMIAIGALLAVNLLVLLYVLLRDDAPESAAPAASAIASGTGGAAGATPGAASAAPAASAGSAALPGAATSAGAPPAAAAAWPAPAAAPASLPAAAEVRPLQAEAGVADDEAAPPYADTPPVPRDPTLSGGARVQRAPVATDGSVVTSDVPLDVVRASGQAARLPAGPERDSGAAAGVPSINDLAPQATAGLPALSINLHVYAGDPRQDFVVLNGRRYQQGAQLQEGPTLERITSDGVVLNHRGLRFLLPRQ